MGKPKNRSLMCDSGVARLYWAKVGSGVDSNLPDESKSINLVDVVDVRKGTDPDRDDDEQVCLFLFLLF